MANQRVGIDITANTAQAESGIRVISRSLNDLGKQAKDMAGPLASLQTALGALGIGYALKEVMTAALQMDRLNKLFNAAAGNVNLAAREMEYIKGVANKMGLDVLSAAESYGKFMASIKGTTLEGEKGRKVFESVSGASAALGLSADETKGVFNALQQMMSKGKVQAEELRGQLGERLPGAFKMAAQAMGVSTAELDKMLVSGKLMADDLLPKLAEQLDKTYGAAATEGAKSAAAEINRFNNALLQSKSAFGSALMPTFTSLLTNVFTPLVGLIERAVRGLQGMAAAGAFTYNQLKTGFGAILTGKAFTANGRVEVDADAAENKRIYDEAVAGINKQPLSTDYTTAETLKNAQNKASTPLQKAAKGPKYSRANDLLLKNILAYSEAAKQATLSWQEFNLDSIRAETKAIEEAAAAAKQATSDWQEFNLDSIREETKANEEAAAAIKKMYDQSAIGGMTNAIERYRDMVKDIGRQMDEAFTQVFSHLEDAITNSIVKMKLDFKSLFQFIQQEAVRVAVARPLTSAIAGAFNPGSGTKFDGQGNITASAVPAGALAQYAAPIAGVAVAIGLAATAFASVGHASQEAEKRFISLTARIKEMTITSQGVIGRASGKTFEVEQSELKAILDAKTAAAEQLLASAQNEKLKAMDTVANYLQQMGNSPVAIAEAERRREAINNRWDTTIANAQTALDLQIKSNAVETQQLLDKQALGNNQLLLQEMELQGQKDSIAYYEVLDKVHSAELYGLDATTQAIKTRIWALEKEKAATESTISALSKTVDIAISAANAIKDIQGGSLSTDSPEQKYLKAKAAFSAASDAQAGELGKALLAASQPYNASGAGYQSDYLAVMTRLQGIAGMDGTTTAEKQLTVLEQIRDALKNDEYGLYQSGTTTRTVSGFSGTRTVSTPVYSTGITAGEGNDVTLEVLKEQNRLLTALLSATTTVGTKVITATETTAKATTTTAQATTLAVAA